MPVGDPTDPVFVSNTPSVNAPVTDTVTLSPSTGVKILVGSGDPTSGAAAPLGSIFLRTNGNFYVKTGSANTAWTQGGGGAPAGNDTDIQFNSSGAFAGDDRLVWAPVFPTFHVDVEAGGTAEIIGGDNGLNNVTVTGGSIQVAAGETGSTIAINADASTTVQSSGKVFLSSPAAVNVVTLQVFANNAAAISGGLSAGDLYRTGANPDPVCVVH